MHPQVIAGRYEVLRAIGSGGMGTVWLCRDTVLGREVAIKRVGALPGEPAAAARAMREARIAASLNDAHTVSVYDIVDEDDAHWLVMEFVDGQSLAEQIRDEGALPVTQVATMGAAVAGALAKAHQRGIVHRDIKPGNILITKAGTPKVSDFGIARAHADDQLTQTGFMTGTPTYLSPELARGGDPTSASDVWALGATLYYAVEGQPAYEAQANPLATLQAIASGAPRPMELAGPLGGAIAAMMNPDVTERWNMATAARQLDRIAHGDTTMALPAGAAFGAGAAATEVISQAEGTQRMGAPVLAPSAYEEGSGGGRGAEPTGPERESRLGWWIVGLILLILLLLGLAYALINGFGSNTPTPRATTTVTSTNTHTQPPSTTTPPTTTSSSTTSSSSTTATTTTTTTAPNAGAMKRFIRNYYADVTKADKRDQTWAELTPAMQARAGGRAGYEAFWSTISSVDVGEMTTDPATGAVTAKLTFHEVSGGTSDETHRLGLVPNDKSFLINSDNRV
ncbi:MAG TPA: serine/threonine-protein kinase [Pedococcus sp.]|nr:serine/threonine-protein kinase [Pedococcus sp.]